MLRVAWTVLFVWPGSGLLACSDGAATSEAFISSYCGLVADCCPQEVPGASDRCVSEAKPPPSVADSYDPAIGSACLDEFRAAYSNGTFCNDYLSVVPRCEGAYAALDGLRAPGEACQTDGECSQSMELGRLVRCVRSDTETDNRICQVQAVGSEGDGPCFATISADQGAQTSEIRPAPSLAFTCDRKDNLVCSGERTCVRILEEGDQCFPGNTIGEPCVDGAYCDGTQLACVARSPIGSDCSTSRCVQTAYCDEGSRTCSALRARGEACMADIECDIGFCRDGECVGFRTSWELLFICTGF